MSGVRLGLIAWACGALLLAMGAQSHLPAAHAGEARTSICHLIGAGGSNPRFVKIRVSQASLDQHRAHGDIVPAPPGACPDAPPPDCDAVGLPCSEVPEVPGMWAVLMAVLVGTALARLRARWIQRTSAGAG